MCPYGTIGEFLDEGINQSVKTASNCASNDDNKGCFPDSTLFADSLKSTVGKESQLVTWNPDNLWATSARKDDCYDAQ